MKDFYLQKIQSKKLGNQDVYEKVLHNTFGKQLTSKELSEQSNDKLIDVMFELDREVKIKVSPYDIKKLTFAIQNSRSGIGLSAITIFNCAFCGEKENWGNTAVPKICRKCAEEMATNFVLYNLDIKKS